MSPNNEPSGPKSAGAVTPPISPAGPASLRDDLLARTISLFGQGEVMPCEASRFPGIFQQMLEKFKTPCTNQIVAVKCDSTSNLCAIVFNVNNQEEFNSTFLANPWFRNTVFTTWRSMVIIWFRVNGWRPHNCQLPGMLWISDGLLPAVQIAGPEAYPTGFPHQDGGTTVRQIEFEELKWDPNLHEEFLLLRLEDRHGPLLEAVDRRPVLNPNTAARFLIARLGLRYRFQSDGFTMTDAAGKRVSLSKSNLGITLQDWLTKRAARVGLPPLPEAMVEAVIATIIRLVAIGPEEGLDLFVSRRLERHAGGSVTSPELLAAYQAYCADLGAAQYPEQEFYKQVTAAIRSRLSLGKAHDLLRPSSTGRLTSRNGWHNLKVIPDEADEAGGTDEPDDLAK